MKALIYPSDVGVTLSIEDTVRELQSNEKEVVNVIVTSYSTHFNKTNDGQLSYTVVDSAIIMIK